jgi:RimJ/RimL family protein N-acetyltransferase
MPESNAKAHLHRYLRTAREALLWKLDGLSEYDIRRPLTPTGTNLLGLVKHASGVETVYFGDVFGRPFDEPLPWMALDAEPNADMWATADESREDIVGLYHRVWKQADATIEALSLDAIGQVSWWPEERREVTLAQILVHVTADLQRHAGHADIVRELIDGAAGMRAGNENLPPGDQAWWEGYRNRLERVAKEVGKALMNVTLREVSDGDLPVFWAQSNEPEGIHMAAFTAEDPSDRTAFDAHWARIRQDPAVVLRAVVGESGEIVGHAAVFGPPEEREVTYWIGRQYWGRGAATAALRALLAAVPERPLHARAAADNGGSVRVLEKCGFVVTGNERGFANARGEEIDEVLLTLRAEDLSTDGLGPCA